jgi:hypothetical protein
VLITTDVVSLNPAQARCTPTILFDVSDLWQVSGINAVLNGNFKLCLLITDVDIHCTINDRQ